MLVYQRVSWNILKCVQIIQTHMDDSKITWTPLSFRTPEWSECTAKGSAVPKVFPLQTCGGLCTAGSHDVPYGFASPCETESPKPIAHGKPGVLGGSKKNWNFRSILRPSGSAEEQVLRLPDGKQDLPRWVEGLLLGSAARNRDQSGEGRRSHNFKIPTVDPIMRPWFSIIG